MSDASPPDDIRDDDPEPADDDMTADDMTAYTLGREQGRAVFEFVAKRYPRNVWALTSGMLGQLCEFAVSLASHGGAADPVAFGRALESYRTGLTSHIRQVQAFADRHENN